MKYILLFIAIILFFPCRAQREFAPIGAEWYYEQHLGFNPPVFGYVRHRSIKDSVIEGHQVKVLEISSAINNDSISLLGFEYLLQKGDTILYWKGGEFHVLYNFSLQKGDSLLLYSEMPNQCDEQTNYGWTTIDSTYTVTIGDNNLKAYTSSAANGSIWAWGERGLPIYESIGSLQYLFPQNAFCGVYDGIPELGLLRCYTDGTLGTVKFVTGLSCDSTSNYGVGNKLTPDKQHFWVYPNPAENVLNLIVQDYQAFENYHVELFDPTGRKVLSAEIKQSSNLLELDGLSKGNYILLLKRKDEIIASGSFNKK